MSRSGYGDEYCDWRVIRWRGAVAAAIRGKRGQAFLLEMWKAMQALPKPELIEDELEKEGAVCAIGSVGRMRGIDMANIDPQDRETVAAAFGIPFSLACEIMFMNDEGGGFSESPDIRFRRMKKWIEGNLRPVEDKALPQTAPAG